MKRIDLAPAAPAECLAAEETLLNRAEAGAEQAEPAEEWLLFWEPRETFVVVGYANQVAAEVNLTACEQAGVPVLRRCSGGGAIVQLPGGLNYALILRISEAGFTHTITAANQFIMERNRMAIETMGQMTNDKTRNPKSEIPDPKITVRGHTDLCIGNLKFSGNSQRRRKHFLLFHGTLLLNCDLHRIGELLPMPSFQPDYRAARPHADFVANLNQPVAAVKAALAEAWNATATGENPPLDEIQKLARGKYATRAWNFKW